MQGNSLQSLATTANGPEKPLMVDNETQYSARGRSRPTQESTQAVMLSPDILGQPKESLFSDKDTLLHLIVNMFPAIDTTMNLARRLERHRSSWSCDNRPSWQYRP